MKKFLFLLIGGFLLISLFSVKAKAEEIVADSPVVQEYLYTPRLLPDSPFYFLKGWKEKVELTLATSPEKQVAKRMEIANRRLSEAKALLEEKPDLAASVMAEYQDELVVLQEKVAQLPEEKADWLKQHLAEVNWEHYQAMWEMYQSAPEPVQEKIEEALQEEVYEKVMQSLPEEKQAVVEEKVMPKVEQFLQKADEMQGNIDKEELKATGAQVKEEIQTQLQNKAEEIQNRVQIRKQQ